MSTPYCAKVPAFVPLNSGLWPNTLQFEILNGQRIKRKFDEMNAFMWQFGYLYKTFGIADEISEKEAEKILDIIRTKKLIPEIYFY
jgi:hypothetical protein